MSDDRPRSFGRRQGRRLRRGRRQLLEHLLPAVRLAPPAAGGCLDPPAAFAEPPRAVWLEIGFGAGEHLAAQAAAHPEIAFIGCETYLNGVASLLSHIDRLGLSNVRLFDDDARLLLGALPAASIARVFVLFADPWPKKRHHKRRFISPATLDVLARLLEDSGELRFASDHMGYVRWTLEHVLAHSAFAWPARRPGDWRRRPEDGFETRYEAKALARGAPCVHLRFRRLARG